MLSGEHAFRGDSAAETMAAIAQKDPSELAESSGRFPPALERVLRHCLEKRSEDRFDTAHDLAFAIEMLLGGASAPRVDAAPAKQGRSALRWALAALLAVVALSTGMVFGGRLLAPAAPRFRQLSYHRGYVDSARFSPDGQTVIFASTRRDESLRIYSTRLDSIESRPLDLPQGATVVGISRTGEMALLLHCAHHGFWIRSGTLATVGLAGGSPREILEHVTGADISPDGKDLAVVREVGKRQRLEFPVGKVVLETDGWVSDPRISPDGTRVAFLEHSLLRRQQRLRQRCFAGRARRAPDRRVAGRTGPRMVSRRKRGLVHVRAGRRRSPSEQFARGAFCDPTWRKGPPGVRASDGPADSRHFGLGSNPVDGR